MILGADTVPSGQAEVWAAYLVFLALVLVYLVITAVRVARLERDLTELNQLSERTPAPAEAKEPVA